MSVIEHGRVLPLTAVAWTSSNSYCPRGFVMISITEHGATANFTRGFPIKSGYYLCFSKDMKDGVVLSDIQIILDKDAIPHGYSYIKEFLDPKTSVSKKKRVVVRMSPVADVQTAVLDIKLTGKSKMLLQHYTIVGEIQGYVLWCRKGPFYSLAPKPKVRSCSLDDTSSHFRPLQPRNLPTTQPSVRLSNRRCTLQGGDVPDASADPQAITALDGVPFTLHPDLNFQMNGTALQMNFQLSNIRLKSVKDIENEYNYTFDVEESAAKRIRPSVSS